MRPIFTRLLADKKSHLSRHLKTAYPATLEQRKHIRDSAGDILVEPGDAHAGTVGTAFDFLSGFLLIENHVPLNPAPTRGWRPIHGLITEGLTGVIHDNLPYRLDDDTAYRAIWVLAELGSIVRSGYSNPDGKLETVLRDAKSGAEELLAIAPTDGVRQLRELEAVATEHLFPYLADPLTTSASFPAIQEIVQAESDIIAGDVLLDYKTGTTAPHKTTGVRTFFPAADDIYQILGYGLMDDPDDGHGINAVGLYAARYGSLQAWDLPDLLRAISGGQTVNVDAARASFRFALEADYNAALSSIAR